MLRASCARCTYLGLLWILNVGCVGGYIEIVEEQQCNDYRFRLTCRDLDSHIAVLEAWYTSAEDYQHENSTETLNRLTKPENDSEVSELNQVYVFSSPKHNGVYEEINTTDFSGSVNNSFDISELVNDTVDMGVELVNSSGCGIATFARSYGSWRDGDKRRKAVERNSSINLRAPVSYRCTGVNHCSFVLAEDHPPAARWAPGAVYIKYACFDDTLSVHYCNREVAVSESGEDSEGYIRTPGYPNFYVGEDVCRWKLRAHPDQRIRVTLLDVSLRSLGPFDHSCIDSVSVRDSNEEQLLTSCEQVDLPLRLTSVTNAVEVEVQARSAGAYPKRGVLLHYKSIGCVTLAAPSDGYLVDRNADLARYVCDVNYVFADTRQRVRFLWCYDDNRWNDTVPACIVETAGTVVGNDSAPVTRDKDAKLPPHEQPDMILDIVIPSLLIAALFIGNAFIVLIIYKYRKRKNDDLDDEFNTIPLNTNGNVHTAGNAV